ncbi:MAG: pilus assembly protein [Caulobacteraceae bacterium]|nr:pilus assembly protein [Caulobacteraceae bacterium]
MARRRQRGTAPERILSRFRRDTRGVAAVEFALIAPVLVALYIGLAEFCQAYMADQRTGHLTSQIADIVARSDVVTRDELADVFAIGDILMTPFPTAPLAVRITSITRGTDGVARVDWSRGDGMVARTGTVTVPVGLITNGQSLIMSEATYDYTSPVNDLLPGTTRFSHTFYLRPRQVDRIGCSDC